MITVTKAELIKFIKAQKNNRKLNFQEFSSSDPCGCLMVHFAKSRKFGPVSCGCAGWYGSDDRGQIAIMEKGLGLYDIVINGPSNSSQTYGELKQQLVP